MQKIIVNKKGLSGILVLGLLGSMFIAITVAVGIHIGSENDTLVSLARSQEGGTRLTFIAQCMNADFYNNLLQNRLEEDVIEFLRSTEHIIDPARSFRENLGQELQSHMSQSASSIVSGDAGRVYAAAYDEVPGISCTPVEIAGASASVSIRQREDGVLELSSWTVGQRVKCDDSDADSSLVINLEARNYQLSTRAVAIHDRAVEEILAVNAVLDGTYGIMRYGSGWRLPQDPSVRSDVLTSTMGWGHSAAGAISLMDMSSRNNDGIIAMSSDFSMARDVGGGAHQPEDIGFVCTGPVGTYRETQGGSGQTCRPNGMSLFINSTNNTISRTPIDVPDGAIELKLSEVNADEFTVSWIVEDQPLTIPLPAPVSNLLGQALNNLFASDTIGGYVTHDGSPTHLCNWFKGKPSEASIRGKVIETNPNYISSDFTGGIPFSFISTSQRLQTDQLTNDVDCSKRGGKEEEVIRQNVLLLISKDGESFELNIDNTGAAPILRESDLQDISDNIAKNDMYNVHGETIREVTLRGSYGNSTVEVTSTPPGASNTGASTTLAQILNPTQTGGASTSAGGIVASVSSGSTSSTRSVGIINDLNSLSSAFNSDGLAQAAQSISKTSAAVCKMMGVQNYMSTGEYDKALLALCGLGNLYDVSQARTVCNLAGLYQAIDSGSVQAVLSVLNRMSADLGIPRELITAATIVEAVRSGDAEAVLRAAATAAMLQGYEELARFYSGAAAVIQGLDNGQPLTALSGFFGMIGEQDMANFFGAAAGLQTALDSGDGWGAARAVSQMAGSLGYDGMATLLGAAASAKEIVDAIADLDDLKAACEDGMPWDIVCVIPQVSGGVCSETHPFIRSCAFDYGLPTFRVADICDDMISELGFKIDCTCVYSCPNFPYVMISQQSFAVNINNLYMLLDDAELAGLRRVVGAAGLIYALTQADADLMQYCQLDP